MHAAPDMHAGHVLHALDGWGGDTSSLVTLGAMAGAYALGTRRIWARAGTGRGVRTWQAGAFSAGLGVLALALLSPIDALAGELFSAHMTQHVLLAVVAPPLLVVGAPGVPLLWALPPAWRRRIAATVRRPRLAATWRALTDPLIACGVHAFALWSWHAPRLYVAALQHGGIHFLEHLCFVATAVCLWWGILRPRRPRHVAYAVGIVVLFLTTLQSGALGALLTFSPAPWFSAQDAGAARLHLTPLQDQQLAGLIMWVPGGLLYAAAMGVLFVAWMRRLDRASPSGIVTPRSVLSGTTST